MSQNNPDIMKNRKLLILIISTIVGILSVSAQNTITGSVIQISDKSPIPGAYILIKGVNGKILAYGVSDSNGHFSIKLSCTDTELSINATMLGYKPYSVPLISDGKQIIITMEENSQSIEEVVVKIDPIQENGDTIKYNVSSFVQRQDRTIGDVLKRMPGIDVANNGKIQYQGIEISKFYIEGNDLLGGKYGIATNGISYDDIGAVEVMENHQPMQVLRGLSFSDQTAINLKMKNKAKATFLVYGILSGGGSEQPKGMLWFGDIFTMMVTGKYQMITTFKGNNTGHNLSEQLIDFTTERLEETTDGYISLSIPIFPNLQRNRSFFNRSWMVSSNHLIKSTKGSEFKAKIDYNNDRISAQGANSTTYFLESGNKIIFENKNSLAYRGAVTGKFSFEINKKSYFLNNTLSTDFSWNNLELNTIGSFPNSQSAKILEHTVSNYLKVIKRFANNKLVSFTSCNVWNSLPEKLIVNHNEKEYGQEIKQHSFYTDERASLGFVFNKILLSFDAGVSGYFRGLNTELFGMSIKNQTESEALTTDYLRVFASPKFEWTHKRLDLTFNFPINLYSYFFSGTIRNRTELFISPSLVARFRITPRMSLTLRGSTRRSPASLHEIHNSSILTDYRSFNSGVEDYYASSGQSLSASYNYRNAQNGIFVMVMGNYGWNKSKFGTVQNIINNYIFYSYKSQPSDSRNAMVFLNISKTLDFMRGTIGVKGSYRRMENNLLSQGLHTDYCNDYFSLSPFINGNISTYLNWNFRFIWEKALLKISNMPKHSSDNFRYSGNITFTPYSLIKWSMGGEFYRNQIKEGHYKNMFMLDTKLMFNINKRIEISVSATNLFNKKEYSYNSYSMVSQTERSSNLRGREFMISLYFKK